MSAINKMVSVKWAEIKVRVQHITSTHIADRSMVSLSYDVCLHL